MNETTDYNKFVDLIWVFANDAGIKTSRAQIKIKFNALKNYSIEQVSKAANKLFKHRGNVYHVIPLTSEFIKAIEEETQIEPKTKAQIQLDIVMKYFNYYGSNCDHVFKDLNTRYLMTNRWSFRQIGLMTADELKWFKINFVKDYADFEKQEKVPLIEEKIKNAIPADNLKRLIK